jgi:hypothetical protein
MTCLLIEMLSLVAHSAVCCISSGVQVLWYDTTFVHLLSRITNQELELDL